MKRATPAGLDLTGYKVKKVKRAWPFPVSLERGVATITLPPRQPKRDLATLPDALF